MELRKETWFRTRFECQDCHSPEAYQKDYATKLLYVGLDHNIYSSIKGGFRMVHEDSTPVIDIEVITEDIIVAIDLENKLKFRNNGEWSHSISSSCCMISVALVDYAILLGVGTDNQLYTYFMKNESWSEPIPTSGGIIKIVYSYYEDVLYGLPKEGNKLLFTKYGNPFWHEADRDLSGYTVIDFVIDHTKKIMPLLEYESQVLRVRSIAIALAEHPPYESTIEGSAAPTFASGKSQIMKPVIVDDPKSTPPSGTVKDMTLYSTEMAVGLKEKEAVSKSGSVAPTFTSGKSQIMKPVIVNEPKSTPPSGTVKDMTLYSTEMAVGLKEKEAVSKSASIAFFIAVAVPLVLIVNIILIVRKVINRMMTTKSVKNSKKEVGRRRRRRAKFKRHPFK
ncbi:uncharacterized protein [Ptychodera flava]|uniref:uncharacterized protein n=1 Tax=Ptychodera flava TaxID=63121 RepID=UPI00396A814A